MRGLWQIELITLIRTAAHAYQNVAQLSLSYLE